MLLPAHTDPKIWDKSIIWAVMSWFNFFIHTEVFTQPRCKIRNGRNLLDMSNCLCPSHSFMHISILHTHIHFLRKNFSIHSGTILINKFDISIYWYLGPTPPDTNAITTFSLSLRFKEASKQMVSQFLFHI